MKTKRLNINLQSLNNPFLDPALAQDQITMDQMNNAEEYKSKENPTFRVFTYSRSVDKMEFVKVDVSDEFKALYKSLSIDAKAVIGSIIIHMGFDDIVDLHKSDIFSYNKIGIAKRPKVFKELIDKRLIARVSNDKRSTDYHLIFINPKYFFRGIRYKYYKRVFEIKAHRESLKNK